jgi:hypothetical protein
MNTAHVSPSSTSQKYSYDENLSANSASVGRRRSARPVPKRPPIAENTRPAPSASSACPLRVIAYASSVYAADAGVPACACRQPGMSPEKIAIAVAVTIAAIAGIGAMKNVTGTRSAVAIVRGQARHGAHEQAEQRRRQHHEDVVRLEHQRECLLPGEPRCGVPAGPEGRSRLARPRRYSRLQQAPRASGTLGACRTRSGCRA